MILVQEKLDVKNKSQSNYFNWRGQFTPDFVEYLLNNLSLEENSTIADPFSGSGTVLIESLKKNHNAIGFELNPTAYFMSKFYCYCSLSILERKKLIEEIKQSTYIILSEFSNECVFNSEFSNNYRESYKNLLLVAEKFKSISTDLNKSFLINVLFFSENDKKSTIKDSLYSSIEKLSKILLELPFSNREIKVYNSDCRNINKFYTNQIDLVITSPPYINVFNYHQNYRAIIEVFDYNILNVANSEFGSNRKNRGNRLLTVIQYCIDMESCFTSLWNAVKQNANIVFIVGRESMVRKTPFFNSEIICDIIEEKKLFELYRKEERSFKNKFGQEIIEDILFFKKPDYRQAICENVAYKIAKKHLLKSMNYAPTDVIEDFNNALEKLHSIKQSPIFKL